MAEINKKRLNPGWYVLIVLLPLIDLVLIIRYFIRGKNVAVLNPKGFIAQEQFNLMVYTVVVLLAVTIPTLIIAYFIAWRYRESNAKTIRSPQPTRSKFLVLSMWVIPTVVMLVLARSMLPATQKLAPQKSIASNTKPLTIQVISLRWKWLFIYPEQRIATVNFIQVPVNTPVKFEMTADETPMSSFWIPNLGGQLYSMTGHVNRLNLIADTPGDYPGSTPEINGIGFAGMKFTTRASYSENFDEWVQEVKRSPNVLNTATYESLLKPSQNNPVEFYSAYERNLYDNVVTKYTGHSEGSGHHR